MKVVALHATPRGTALPIELFVASAERIVFHKVTVVEFLTLSVGQMQDVKGRATWSVPSYSHDPSLASSIRAPSNAESMQVMLV